MKHMETPCYVLRNITKRQGVINFQTTESIFGCIEDCKNLQRSQLNNFCIVLINKGWGMRITVFTVSRLHIYIKKSFDFILLF